MTLPEAQESGRLLGVYRRWKREQWLRGAATWYRFASAEDHTMAVASLSGVLLLPLDLALWKLNDLLPWMLLAPLPGEAVAIAFLTICTINAALLDTYLSLKTPDEESWPPWVRTLRFFLGGVPLVGLYAVPLWRRLRENRPEWSRRHEDHGARLKLDEASPRNSLIRMRWEGFADSTWGMAWLFVGGVGVLLLAACWLAARAAVSSSAYRILVIVSGSLHLAAFAVFAPHLRTRASRRRLSRKDSALLLFISVFWLLPVPCFSLLALLLSYQAGRETARSESVVFRVLIREKDAGRSLLWLRLEDRLQLVWPTMSPGKRWWSPPPRVDRGIEPGQEDRQILRLYELASYSVFFDAAVLAWALLWVAEHHPDRAGALGLVHRTALVSSLCLHLIGLCAIIAHLISVLLRSRIRLRLLDRHPYARYLAKTQFLLLWGWVAGMILRAQGAKEVAALLVLVTMLLVLLKGFSLILRPALPRVRTRQGRLDLLIGIAFLLFVLTLGAFAPTIDLLTPTLAVWAVLYPVRAFLLGRILVPWLLRPFTWKDLFASRVPIRLRALLAGLAVPAVLPLGGLAVPLQIFVRHRLWPRAEAFWWEREHHGLVR